jgi:hypothetical protein
MISSDILALVFIIGVSRGYFLHTLYICYRALYVCVRVVISQRCIYLDYITSNEWTKDEENLTGLKNKE